MMLTHEHQVCPLKQSCPLHSPSMNSSLPPHLTYHDEYKSENTVSRSFGPGFEPGPWDVVCARGKQAYNHTGNKNFRKLVSAATEKYAQAQTKLERTIIVSEVVDAIRAKGNGFIRKNERGEWVEVDDVLAREKTGQHFRNSLGNRYKSSVVAKRKRREQKTPQLIGNLQDVVFSNPQVGRIMTTLTRQISSGLLSDHDVFEKLCDANMELLRVFKSDPGLTDRFIDASTFTEDPLDS